MVTGEPPVCFMLPMSAPFKWLTMCVLPLIWLVRLQHRPASLCTVSAYTVILNGDIILSLFSTCVVVPSAIPDQVTVVVLENSSVTFQCQASGIPSPTISWYRNGAMLSPSTDPRISLGAPTQQLQITGVYRVTRNITINSTATTDAGVYSCVGVNQYGNGSNIFIVTVQCKS